MVKMKKITFFLIVTMVSLTTAFSQSDAKSKKLLDEVSAKMNTYQNMYVEFKYVLDNTKENVHHIFSFPY